MTYPPNIQNAIDYGYSFHISDYFSHGWEIVRQRLPLFAGYTFVVFLISVVLGLIPVVGQLASIIVNPCLMAGYIVAAHELDSGRDISFSTFFRGFDYVARLVIAYLIVSLITIILMIVLVGIGVASMGTGWLSASVAVDTIPSFLILPFVLIMLLGFWAYTLVCWYSYFIVLYNMRPWDAIMASVQVVRHKWLQHFLFFLLFAVFIILT